MIASYEQLEKIKGVTFSFGVSGKKLSAFRSGGKIYCLASPSTSSGLIELVNFLSDKDFAIIGGGSNILIPDEGYRGVLISTKSLKGFDRAENRVYAGAGELLPAISVYAKYAGLSGMEELSGIPGCLGGAVKNNAGAYGLEISKLIENVIAVDLNTGSIVTKSAEEMDFNYRDSRVKRDKLLIVGASLILSYDEPQNIVKRLDYFKAKRKDSQPSEPSLGSTFKRVNGVSAGLYIDRAGLKGARVGGAEVSEKHANFIINKGNATSSDFIKLVEIIKNTVFKLYGIKLIEEVEYLDGNKGKNFW